ncbi:hypothetical protein HK100_003264, partial [Physocladia obscura]
MILGIGCDIVKVARIRTLLERGHWRSTYVAEKNRRTENTIRKIRKPDTIRFARFILSPTELEAFKLRFFSAQKDSLDSELPEKLALFLAGRWAAKEACYKAMSPHFKLHWSDVSILNVEGKPTIDLADHTLEKFGKLNSHVSISHDGGYAIAY